MKTCGQIFQEARTKKNLEYSDIFAATKIHPHYLKAIESDDYSRLPNSTVAKGFIKNYAQFLDLNWQHVLAIFRRDFIENLQGQIIPRGMTEPVHERFLWTPKSTLIAVMALIFILFGSYLFYQYRQMSGPPSLRLDEPADNQSVTTAYLVISGRTDPEATININGQPVVLEKAGQFFFRVELTPGENQITVTAASNSHRTTVVTRKVNYQPSP